MISSFKILHFYIQFHHDLYHYCVCVCEVTCLVQLFAILWTLVCQTVLSMVFSRQEYWSGLPFPPLGSLPEPEIKPASLVSLALARMLFTISTTWEAILLLYVYIILRAPLVLRR